MHADRTSLLNASIFTSVTKCFSNVMQPFEKQIWVLENGLSPSHLITVQSCVSLKGVTPQFLLYNFQNAPFIPISNLICC